MSSIKKLGVFFSLSILLLVSCDKSSDNSKRNYSLQTNALNINLGNEPNTLDPRKARSLNDLNVLKIFMEGLTRVGPNSEVKMGLCKKYEISKDLKTYTFYLRNAKWSNNTPITADDFVYTWKQILSPNYPAGQAHMLYALKNAEKVKKGLLPSCMLGVTSKGSNVLIVELENPAPYFLELLSTPCFFPVSAKADKENSSWAEKANSYVSSGPFKMISWKHNNQIIAEKNEKYWDFSSVKLKNLVLSMVDCETGIQMFENKELDWEGSPLSTLPLDALTALKMVGKLHSKTIAGTSFLRTNIERGPLSSVNFRRALALSLNRKEIVKHIYQDVSSVSTGLVPSSFHLKKSPYFEDNDVALAKKYLQKALDSGEILEENLHSITLSYVRRDRNHKLAQLIQDHWRKALNIKIQLKPIELKVFFDTVRRRDFDLAISSWEADINDPINFLEVFKTKETTTNNTNWESKSYKELLNKSGTTLDPRQRLHILRSSEEILIKEMPIIPICQASMHYVKDPRVKNVIVTDLGGLDFKWAFIDKGIEGTKRIR